MLDIGMLELSVVAVVALLVLGPERLPGAMRTAGRMVGQARSMIGRFQQEMEVQARNLDMKDRLEKNRQALAEYQSKLNQSLAADEGESGRE